MAGKYPNSGSIGKNERMRPGTQDPPLSGQCEVDGVAYWISGWTKNGDSGKWISLSFRRKDASAKPAKKQADDDDAIPF